MTTKTYELPVGSDVSVRTNEAIDSATAAEGQTFDAEVTRDAKDANGDVVIPRGSRARIVIKSASKGGRFRGQSDLAGLGANKRTAEYTGAERFWVR